MATTPPTTEVDILADVIVPRKGNMFPAAARAVMQWKFSDRAVRKMRRLLARNNKGVLSPTEEEELERYCRVGMLIDLLQSKARLSLKRARSVS